MQIDGWKTSFLLSWLPGRCYVSFREGRYSWSFFWAQSIYMFTLICQWYATSRQVNIYDSAEEPPAFAEVNAYTLATCSPGHWTTSGLKSLKFTHLHTIFSHNDIQKQIETSNFLPEFLFLFVSLVCGVLFQEKNTTSTTKLHQIPILSTSLGPSWKRVKRMGSYGRFLEKAVETMYVTRLVTNLETVHLLWGNLIWRCQEHHSNHLPSIQTPDFFGSTFRVRKKSRLQTWGTIGVTPGKKVRGNSHWFGRF